MDADDDCPPLAVPIDEFNPFSAPKKDTDEPSAPSVSSADNPVGVTIITGYLGAGKSTVVDAKNLKLLLDGYKSSGKYPGAFYQIGFADVVILNKVDLVALDDYGQETSSAIDLLEEEIKNINSLATIIRSVRCQVDLHLVLDRQSYDPEHVAHFMNRLEDGKLVSENQHDSGLSTLCICTQQELDLNKGVRETYEIVPSRKWKSGEQKMNKIVLIGRNFDNTTIKIAFEECNSLMKLV